jgi:hypothetical protein
MGKPSWRAIAELLAERLAVHAFCPQHSLSDAEPDCPFCADRAAYWKYLAAGGLDFRMTAPEGARSVPLSELAPSSEFRWK